MTRMTRHPDVVTREIDDAVFLVGPDNDAVFHLNTTGAAIWRLLAEPLSASDAVATLQAAFPELPEERLQNDVDSLLDELDARGFLVRLD